MTRIFRQFLFLLATTASICHAIADEEADRKFFADKVFPVLERNCFKCHGGGDHLKSNFRITSRDGLLRGGDFGPAYESDDPASSHVIEAIGYKNEDYQMPPKAKLPEDEIMILTQWIDSGAPYDPALEIKGDARERRGFTVTEEDRDWWAYRPVSKSDPPEVPEAEWQENGIDAFVRAQLDREGLTPNSQASPHVLVRRLYYDLIGLPPTPQEVQAFVAAARKDFDSAYAGLVDDLLSRPQYGEKWARHWLDLVRYAESNGFERDNSKPYIWRYRDYVIRAFNENKPYDRFVIEQLAGDEIENPTMDSMVATGYHRLMQWDDEPADRKQHVYDVLADDVQTTSETFLGTTMGCARCHDHKADPISQKDYYSFMSFFTGVTHYKTEGTLVSWATAEEKMAFEKERQQKLTELRKKKDELSNLLSGYVLGKGAGDRGAEVITFVDDARGKGMDWFYTTTRPTDDWSDVGFVNKAWFKAKGGFGVKGVPNSHVNTPWETKEIWMRTTFGLTSLPGSLILDLHHDEDVEVYLNGALIHQAKGFTTDYETVVLGQEALDVLQTGKNVLAVHCLHGNGGRYIDVSLKTSSRAALIEKLVDGKAGKQLEKEIETKAGRNLVAEFRNTLAAIAEWQAKQPGTPLNVVTEKGADPGPMNIHLRGSAHALGDAVSPAFPAVLASSDSNPLPAKAMPTQKDGRITSGRRIALAQWIVDPGNPLSARVMMNRLWQHHFGRGIVPSSSDFGKLGEKPTHPELLDWLATQFIESGWDMKAMHRLIVMSHTYRMSSEPNSASLELDPENKNFWRYSMRRLTAEEIRDTILSVSGKLNLKSFGDWVYPPLPPEVLATASRPGKGWPVSKDESDYYRRSLYVHVKRSLRHQMLADFDQADTDTGCAVRFSTTVPTQALSMLNSKFINDQAVLFAGRMRQAGESVSEQITCGLELALQREPTPNEIADLTEFYQKLQNEAGLTPQDALDRVALLTLNLNEFMYLD